MYGYLGSVLLTRVATSEATGSLGVRARRREVLRTQRCTETSRLTHSSYNTACFPISLVATRDTRAQLCTKLYIPTYLDTYDVLVSCHKTFLQTN